MRFLGTKRKQAEEDSASWVQIGDLLNVDIETEMNGLIQEIRNGSHPELLRRGVSLQQLREKQIASCERHRKEQIKNINQLYDYEVEDANALFEVCFAKYL